ncbi:MAG: transposase [Ignavibacteria bacterium]|nr:transposase [Ignavibacteria bacterium]
MRTSSIKLLQTGPKNDKIDSVKLCTLLRNGSLKEVYHTTDELYKLRKLVSVYEDFLNASVRLKNQRSSMFLSEGKDHKKEKILTGNTINKFIVALVCVPERSECHQQAV